jgi:hypothetical protein
MGEQVKTEPPLHPLAFDFWVMIRSVTAELGAMKAFSGSTVIDCRYSSARQP